MVVNINVLFAHCSFNRKVQNGLNTVGMQFPIKVGIYLHT